MSPTPTTAIHYRSVPVAWNRFSRWVVASATHRAIVILFGLGLLLRVLVMAFYSDVVLIYYGGDSARYLRLPFTGYHGLFSDPAMPAGYPAFLDVARWVSRDIVFTIGLQHLMGLATAALILLAVRRIGVPLWLGMIPAGVVLLSGDHLFLETALLTETLWMLLIIAGLWAAMNARASEHRPLWLAASGALLGLAAIVRHVALPFAFFVALWAAWELAGTWKGSVRAATTVLLPAVVIVAAYVAVAHVENGYAGFTNMSGFSLYGRVGQFANCHDFTPPAGTAGLCNDPIPINQRDGTFYYQFDLSSPLYRAGFSGGPQSSPALGRFAHAVIIHQPFAYLKVVAKDLLRYIAPDAVTARPQSGVDPSGMSFASAVPANQAQTPTLLASEYAQDYTHVSRSLPSQSVREALGAYQEIFRLDGFATSVLMCLALVGLVVSRGSIRRAMLLFTVLAIYLYVAPVALSSYDVRYGVPAGLMLSVAGALGGWSVWWRVVARQEIRGETS